MNIKQEKPSQIAESIAQPQVSPVIFLGVAEKATLTKEGNTNFDKLNLTGLKHVVFSFIYPLNISQFSYVFAFPASTASSEYQIKMRDEAGAELGNISVTSNPAPINFEAFVTQEGESKTEGINSETTTTQNPETKDEPNSFRLLIKDNWTPVFVDLKTPKAITITKPQTVNLFQVTSQGEKSIGSLYLGLLEVLPLTKERIAAIQSDPNSLKTIKAIIGCNNCPSKIQVYAALERNPKLEEDGTKWYTDVEDNFTCSCGKTNVSLTYIKKNLHGLLGSHQETANVSLTPSPLYELASFKKLRDNFFALLVAKPNEERLQNFIEKNPLIFYQFPSIRIFHKPSILTSYKADFAILSTNKELLLIEIETTKTKLLTKNGGIGAELTHAVDQARSWLTITDNHRAAFLSSLEIKPEDVSQIRGIVVAGVDSHYNPEELKYLKTFTWERITFLTFTDLLTSLDSLIKKTRDMQ